jgi:hypothetical protein
VRKLAWSALALSLVGAAAAAGVWLITKGDDGDRQAVVPTSTPPPVPRRHRLPAANEAAPRSTGAGTVHRQVQEAVERSAAPRLDQAQRRVARTVHAYITALDRDEGGRACRLFDSGALSGVSWPRDRGACGPSLSASIGYRDPRGYPVFAGVRVARIPAVAIDGAEARVTATTVTRFADHREPSVEDDLIYLRRRGGSWLIAKPDAAVHRAIGVGDIPPRALAPP